MRCFVEKINDESVCVCGEFQRDVKKDPCYQNLQGHSGADFSKNLANDAIAYFQDSGIFSFSIPLKGLPLISLGQGFKLLFKEIKIVSMCRFSSF